MRTILRKAIVTSTFLLLFVDTAIAADLPVIPVTQETTEWCWLAVGQMVFQYFGVPAFPAPNDSYQCGELLAAPMTYHGQCPPVPSGSTGGIRSLLWSYPTLVGQSGFGSIEKGPLSMDDIATEIDNGRPIVIGINPSQAFGLTQPFIMSNPFGPNPNAPEHAALIMGYDADDDTITVADPAPYEAVTGTNPYVVLGAQRVGPNEYRVSRDILLNNFHWAVSLTCISVPSDDGQPPEGC